MTDTTGPATDERPLTLDTRESRILEELLVFTIRLQVNEQLRAQRDSRYANVEAQAKLIDDASRLLGVVRNPGTHQLSLRDFGILSNAVADGLGAAVALAANAKQAEEHEERQKVMDCGRALIQLFLRLDPDTAFARAQAPKHRIIGAGEVLAVGDECLATDAQTWEPMPADLIGKPYAPAQHRPVRRSRKLG